MVGKMKEMQVDEVSEWFLNGRSTHYKTLCAIMTLIASIDQSIILFAQ